MNVVIWVVQVALGLAFILAGFMKATQPREKLTERMTWVEDYSGPQVKLIGSIEVLGGLGLILPAWTGIGPSVVSAFPGTDYGLIRNDQATAPGAVDRWDGTWQSITGTATATVGEAVCASGQTTHVTCGHVTAVDLTVDYGDGNVVRGLIETDVHTDHGDSGGSLFDGAIGLGMVSGGDGTTDYFQPLPPVLAAYDLVLSP